jgi:hypothetical protein
MNLSVWASEDKKSRANVVLPAPLGPAMMMIFFKWPTLEKNVKCAGKGGAVKNLDWFAS